MVFVYFLGLQKNVSDCLLQRSACHDFTHGENFMEIFTTPSVVIWFSTGTLGIVATLVYVFTMRVVIYEILSTVIISTLLISIVFCNLCYILFWISPRSVVKIAIRIRGLFKEWSEFSFFSTNIYLFMNFYVVPFKVIPLGYNTFVPALSQPQSWEQEKFTGGWIWWVRWLRHDYGVVFGQKITNQQWRVSGCVIVM